LRVVPIGGAFSSLHRSDNKKYIFHLEQMSGTKKEKRKEEKKGKRKRDVRLNCERMMEGSKGLFSPSEKRRTTTSLPRCRFLSTCWGSSGKNGKRVLTWNITSNPL